MISLLDGRVGLEGTLLQRTAPLLEAILHFLPLNSSLGALSCSQSSSDIPRWISSWPLNLAEKRFVHQVVKHRILGLAAHEDQLVAIPEGRMMIIHGYPLFMDFHSHVYLNSYQSIIFTTFRPFPFFKRIFVEAEPVPASFRPRTSNGKPLNGPYISWKSPKPYNIGRQYFSTFNKGDSDGFLWADGTTGWSPQSKKRAADYQEKQEIKEKQQAMRQLLGEFDMLDPGELWVQEEGSGEWDGEMSREVSKVDFAVNADDLPAKRQKCSYIRYKI